MAHSMSMTDFESEQIALMGWRVDVPVPYPTIAYCTNIPNLIITRAPECPRESARKA